jgi:MFS family permease
VAGYLAGSIAKLALPVYAANETGSPLVVSGIVLGFTVPRLVLGLPFGVLVDRLDRRRTDRSERVRLGALEFAATGAVIGS